MQEIESTRWILKRPKQTGKKVLSDGIVAQKIFVRCQFFAFFFNTCLKNTVDVGDILWYIINDVS